MFVFLASMRAGLDQRQRVLDAITARPGITKNQIKTQFGVNWRTVDHHVKALAATGHIAQMPGLKNGWCHHLFAANVPTEDRKWFRHLVRQNSAEVITDLATRNLGTYDLRSLQGKERQSILKTITKLLGDGLVVKHGHSRPRYELVVPPPGVQAYLSQMRDSVADVNSGVEGLTDGEHPDGRPGERM